jgi:hypothetical protein
MSRTKPYALLLLALMAASWSTAQEITFKASVDRNTIATGEYLRLTITLGNAQGNITTPTMTGLSIVQGPSRQTNTTFINGRFQSTNTYQWVLTATKPGNYTIGPSEVRIGNAVLRTDPITIEVTKAAAGTGDAAVVQGQGRNPDHFVTLTLSRNKGYVGEQIIANYTLYTRYPSVHMTDLQVPRINGFWTEDVDLGQQNEQRTETINGLAYRVFTLKRQLIIPQRAGKLRIEPFTLSTVVGRGMLFGGERMDSPSNAVEFTSMELPPGPPGNIGAVGEFNVELSAGRTKLKANEAVEVTVKLSGRGNLKLIDAPKLPTPPGLEVFDPKTTDRVSVNSSGMSGSREFQYLVIPRIDGSFTLGPLSVPVLDPKTGTWKELRSGSVDLEVEPGDPTAAGTAAPRGMEVRELDRDIRYIRTGDAGLREHDRFLYGSPAWFAGMAAPLAAFLVLLAWRRREKKLDADPLARRRAQADKVARHHLREAAKALGQNDREPFYAALSKALHGYAQDKFNIGPADLDSGTLAAALAALPDPQDIARRYTSLIEACAMARFAPLEERPRQALYDEAVALIRMIEQPPRP